MTADPDDSDATASSDQDHPEAIDGVNATVPDASVAGSSKDANSEIPKPATEPTLTSAQGQTDSAFSHIDFKSKTSNLLRELAKQAGLKGYSSMPKASLIQLLEAKASGGNIDPQAQGAAIRRSSVNKYPYQAAAWEKASAIAAALFIVGLSGFLVVRNEKFNDPNLVVLIRIMLSTCVAILGATVPGFLQVDLSSRGALVRAGGALALFVLTFWFSPSVIQPEKGGVQEHDGGSTPAKTGSDAEAKELKKTTISLPTEEAKFKSGIRRKDIIEGIKAKYRNNDYERLCQDFSFSGNKSMLDQNVGQFLDHCIDSGQLLKLLVVILGKYGVEGTHGDWQADEMDKSRGPFPVLADGSFDLSAGAKSRFDLQVVFKTTGERFKVLLPEDLDCDIAAQRIITNIFFRDIPLERRAAYLAPGAHFHLLLSDEKENLKGTLRQAGLKNGTEVRVSTQAPMGGYPWMHDNNMADSMSNSHFTSWIIGREYRLLNYISAYLDKRLEKATGCGFSGLQFMDPGQTVIPDDQDAFLEIVYSKKRIPPSLLDYLQDILTSASDYSEYGKSSAALAAARLGQRADSLVPALVTGARDKNKKFASSCVLALGSMANLSEQAKNELHRIASAESNQIEKLYASLMLLRLGSNDELAKVVSVIMDQGDTKERVQIIKALDWDAAPYISPETCKPIMESMGFRRGFSSLRLYRALRGEKEVIDEEDDPKAISENKPNWAAMAVVENLTKDLKNAEPSVRAHAAYSLVHYGEYAKPAIPMLIELLKDTTLVTEPDRVGTDDDRKFPVQHSANNVLGRLGSVTKDASPALVAFVIDRKGTDWVRTDIVKLLESNGSLGENEIKQLETFSNTDGDVPEVKQAVDKLLDHLKKGASPSKEPE